jgi:hypothetical protein
MAKTPAPLAVSAEMSLKEAYDRFVYYSMYILYEIGLLRVSDRLKQQLRHEDTSYIQC